MFRITRSEKVKALDKKVSDLERQVSELKKDLIHDPLTGLKTRAYFDKQCSFYLSGLSRHDDTRKDILSVDHLTLLFFDIDHFKKVNDTYGHQAGDMAIKHVAHAILESFRIEDAASRWGGEEFAALLPGASEEEGAKKADEVREKIASLHFDFDPGFRLTISAGVATIGPSESQPDILQMADKALYKAKERGRNRVVRYSELE